MRTIGLLLLTLYVAHACTIVKNQQVLIADEPRMLKEVTNGRKMLLGDAKDPDQNFLYIANLKGTPQEMGEAFGLLFQQQIKATISNFYAYYIGALQTLLESKKVPAFLAKGLGTGVGALLKRILDLNVIITNRYTNPRYYEQIKGVAAGAKVPERDLKRLNMVPELIKAACTIIGLWNKATSDGQTLHLRALDWDSQNPMNKFPVVIIYHPSDPKLQTHANFAWTGFIGSLTGVSTKVSLGEKVWYPPKNSVKTTRYGNPWTYLFRDILYEATDMNSALTLLYTAHRTCAIHIGLASAVDHDFRTFEYAEAVLNNYNDANYSHYNVSSHPKMPGVAYFDKHVQPSGDTCIGQVLSQPGTYGKWQAQNLWRTVGLSHETGDTQLVVFDLENQIAIASYASADGKKKAYERNPFLINLKELFKPF